MNEIKMVKIEIVFRSLGHELPNTTIEIEVLPASFIEFHDAWANNNFPGATYALKTDIDDFTAKILLRLDLIAYIRVIK